MKVLHRALGVLVMIAGILGLLLSLAGLVGLWIVTPTLTSYAKMTITTFNDSISTSQKVMEITGQALGATVDSVDALSMMLSTTAASVNETQPVLDQVNQMMGETVPASLEAATESLKTAQQAAVVLDSAIKSLETFRFVLSATPLLGAMVDQPAQAYNPEVPLADSLGELASNLETLPATFVEMSVNLEKADDNLAAVQSNLVTMSASVKLISTSLQEYQAMVNQSQSSMEDIKAILTNLQNNMDGILRGVSIGLSLFLLWLLAAQIVILTQGWELFQGTADRMESGASAPAAVEPAAEA
jgi:chromosome segregation ATPase